MKKKADQEAELDAAAEERREDNEPVRSKMYLKTSKQGPVLLFEYLYGFIALCQWGGTGWSGGRTKQIGTNGQADTQMR